MNHRPVPLAAGKSENPSLFLLFTFVKALHFPPTQLLLPPDERRPNPPDFLLPFSRRWAPRAQLSCFMVEPLNCEMWNFETLYTHEWIFNFNSEESERVRVEIEGSLISTASRSFTFLSSMVPRVTLRTQFSQDAKIWQRRYRKLCALPTSTCNSLDYSFSHVVFVVALTQFHFGPISPSKELNCPFLLPSFWHRPSLSPA